MSVPAAPAAGSPGHAAPATAAATPRVLLLSASIGEGHDLPARFLAADIRERRPDAHAPILDGLEAMGRIAERVAASGSSFESRVGNWVFDVEYTLIAHVAPAARFTSWFAQVVGGRGLERLVARERPDVVVSTYPGVTEVLGRLRAQGRLTVPVVSAITDLAGLRYWAHPGVDLHLITHPESAEEVRRIAGPDTRVVTVRGLNDPRFAAPPSREVGRRAFGLPLDAQVVVVSGGGWGVGDLAGAIDIALAVDSARVVVMCGRNEALRERLAAQFDGEPRVALLGFTTQVPELFAAADALIHSTAGLTVLEATMLGCPTISYGWGRGHIRVNNREYARLGMAAVARSRAELAPALRRALAAPRSPDARIAALPIAADVVLELIGGAVGPVGGLAGDHAPNGA